MRADLHLHTTASDGKDCPEVVARKAREAGMTLVAITDHDTVAGVARAQEAGRAIGLPVLSGVELSCGAGEEIHLLGYGMDATNARMDTLLRAQRAQRALRMQAMVEKLALLGMPVDPQEAQSQGAGVYSRLRLADAMIRRGYVPSTKEAFDRYLSPGRAAFVPCRRMPAEEAIRRLTSLGATAVLAHPGRLRMDDGTLQALLPAWIAAGLDGLEAYHATHSDAQCAQYDRMARRHGLLVTGGSDSHGRAGGARIGEQLHRWRSAPADVAALMERIRKKQDAS